MELMAVLEALKALKKPMAATIYSDSSYVVNAIEKGWLQSWLRSNFKGKKNADLWKEYAALAKQHKIRFVWVKGHANNPFNNRCDELATAAADGSKLRIDAGFENGIND